MLLAYYLETLLVCGALVACLDLLLQVLILQDWRETCIRETSIDLVARLSSRVFLGEELCRNEKWLKTAVNYTNHSGGAAIKLNLLPAPLRLPFSCFSSDCKEVRNDIRMAREIINPVVARRRLLKIKEQAENKPVPTFTDVIE